MEVVGLDKDFCVTTHEARSRKLELLLQQKTPAQLVWEKIDKIFTWTV